MAVLTSRRTAAVALTHMRLLAVTRTVLLSASQAALLTLELQHTLLSVTQQTKNAKISSSVGIGVLRFQI